MTTEEQFTRTELLLGPEAMGVLAHSRVAVFGLGGVGSYAAEALARTGIGALDLVDHDRISITNINRQVEATLDTIGLPKAEAMAERIRTINPSCEVTPQVCFYLPDTADRFDFTAYDYVVDAVDTVTGKLQLITRATEAETPIISSMGAANKLDPTAFRVADIYETSICPLAKIIRKECRKRGIRSLKVVYSTEPPHPLFSDGTEVPGNAIDAVSEEASRHGVPGSVAYVPPVVGLIMAGEVVKDISGIRGAERDTPNGPRRRNR